MMMTVVLVLWLVRAFRQQDSISLYISLSLSLFFPCIILQQQQQQQTKTRKHKEEEEALGGGAPSFIASSSKQISAAHSQH